MSTAQPGLRLLIVDDDPLVRALLRADMHGSAGIRVVGEVADGEAAIAALPTCRPDIILLDGRMPGIDSATVTRRLRAALPGVHVVVFSSEDDDELGIRGLRAGAVGFLIKDVGSEALVRSLHGVLRGEAAVSRALALKIVEYLRDVPEAARGVRPVSSPLTPREWEVLDLICAQRSTPEIAADLDLAVETVRTHVKRLLAKLGVQSRAEAAAIAARLRAADGGAWTPEPTQQPGA
jgi:DNA-binding NarL/FixJ family response regulator